MKASANKSARKSRGPGGREWEPEISKDGIDRGLLEESLSKSVWERMLANDDAFRLTDRLQAAMTKTRAKS